MTRTSRLDQVVISVGVALLAVLGTSQAARADAQPTTTTFYSTTLYQPSGVLGARLPGGPEALAAFTYCIEKSTEFQFFNLFSRLCENEMQQRDAEKYPATNEMFGASIYTASNIGRIGVLTSEKGEDTNPVKKSQAKAKAAADKDGKEDED